jgi:hypothetical protein
MKKKLVLAIFISVLLILLVSEVQVDRLANANPWIIFKGVDPIPGTIPPIITILSPQNNTAYDSNTVLFSFNVTKPQPPTALESGLSIVDYYLDDNRTMPYFCNSYSSGAPPGRSEFTYTISLTLPKGGHYIKVEAGGVVLPGNLTIYGASSSSTIVFSTEADPTTTPFPISDAGSVTMLSPSSENYVCNGTSIDIPLTFAIRGTASWMQYAINGINSAQNYKAQETISGNTTLHSVPIGGYILLLFVNNTFTSIVTQFNVTSPDAETSSPLPTLTPTAPPSTTSNPSTNLTATPAYSPSASPEISPSTTSSSTPYNSYSPTQQPSLEPTQSAKPTTFRDAFYVPNLLPLIIGTAIVGIVAIAGVLAYLRKRK